MSSVCFSEAPLLSKNFSTMTSAYEKNINHSDKLGELLKWYQNFDKLDNEQVLQHAYFILKLLSISQLKSVLFSGLLKCIKDIEYDQIYGMQNNLSSYDIYDEEKENNSNDSEKDINVNEINEENEMVVDNKIPWLDLIPNDIILSNVCSCLWMNDIFNFSKCARRYAIICHSPPAMNNFKLYIQGDDICSAKNYFHINRTDHHRLLGVRNLTISACISQRIDIPHYLISFFRQMKHVQHLSCNILLNIDKFAKPYFADVKSISFIDVCVDSDEIIWLLGIDEKSNSNKPKLFKTIYNLETINFHNCTFTDFSLPYLLEMLLPSKSNKLSVLKLQSLSNNNNKWKKYFTKVLKNVSRIRRSLCNLKAFVTSNDRRSFGGIFSFKILSVLQFQLECIHIHSNVNAIKAFPFPFLMQDTKYYETGKQEEILHLKELCICLPKLGRDYVISKILTNLCEDVFLTHLPNKNTGGLQKLCLNFPSIIIANKFVNNSLKIMLQRSTSLKFLQLKIMCLSSQKQLIRFLKCLASAFSEITSSAYHQQRAFVFKLKIEKGFTHYYPMPNIDTYVRKIIDTFLLVFRNGMIHWKCDNYTMKSKFFKGNTRFYSVNGNAFSVMNLNAFENCVAYDTKWVCDCKKCMVNASETTEIDSE